MKRKSLPCALTIAGSDSGGGAGIQADLKTFAALAGHGTSAITCVTAQNPDKVTGIGSVSPVLVRQQIEAVLQAFPVGAIKTGMLLSKRIIEEVSQVLASTQIPLILDPVMVSTSGHELLQPSAKKALIKLLFPRAALLTPNLDELQILLGVSITDLEELRSAARQLHELHGCAVLAKGGHLPGLNSAVDFYHDSREELMLETPFHRGMSTHGTGCTYAAAIASFVARGEKLPRAVQSAKSFISNAISSSYNCGDYSVLSQVNS